MQPRGTHPALQRCRCREAANLVPSTTLITGVVAVGTTQIKFDCDASSGAAVVAEASLLACLSTANVIPTARSGHQHSGDFTASATAYLACPAGTASSCTEATYAVPATFSAAGDTAAQCPPSQAQINAGLFGALVAVANSSEQEVAGGEYLVMYARSDHCPRGPHDCGPAHDRIAGQSHQRH